MLIYAVLVLIRLLGGDVQTDKRRQVTHLSMNTLHGATSSLFKCEWGGGMQVYLTEANAERDALDCTIQRATEILVESQSSDGSWRDCFDTGCMPDAQTAICLHLLGVVDPEWTTPLLARLLSTQRQDGSWGVYPGDKGDLSTSVECYYALQLYGCWTDHTERQYLAQQFIHQHGGLKRCRNLTKMMLAIGGEIPWSWLPSPRLYLLLFSNWFPLSIWDIVSFTRLHIAPMLIVSSLEYVVERTPGRVLEDLMTLPQQRAHKEYKNADSRFPRRQQSSPQMPRRLFRCLKWMIDKREEDGTAAGYHSSTFLVIFALCALGYEESHPEIRSMIWAMRQSFYADPETGYCHQQTCNAHVWNTALAIKAFATSGGSSQSPTIYRAIQYLITKQHHTVGEWVMQNPSQPGGWAFSSNNTTHPDVDDTVACLEALFPHRAEYEQSWWKGVDWLLGMQNRDGGWSAFEKDCNRRFLEWIPANDMKRTMHDPSTPDITARVVEFLVRYRIVPLNDVKIQKAVHWLCKHQERDGSWFGRWGTTYLYGTWCVVKALVAVEISSRERGMEKAKDWLLKVQNTDGSFGESCQSDLQGRFIPLLSGVPTQTAWGLDTLLFLYECEESIAERHRLWTAATMAVHWLLRNAKNGKWHEEMPTGSAFPGALHIRYHIYPKVWPLIALSHYRSATALSVAKGGEQTC